MANMKAENWCFTINNDTDDMFVMPEDVYSYLVKGESETPHILEYVQFKTQKY